MDKEINKKYKEVPFDSLKDGDEFQHGRVDINSNCEKLLRKIDGDSVVYADGCVMAEAEFTKEFAGETVFVKIEEQ